MQDDTFPVMFIYEACSIFQEPGVCQDQAEDGLYK